MPYMPTNMSPNNVALVKGEDIIFHCLIDKYDTIIKVKLTLYDYYDKANSAFIEIGTDDNNKTVVLNSSENIDWNSFDSSILPFTAKDYDVPVFSISIFGNYLKSIENNENVFYSPFLSNLSKITYTIEFIGKDFSIWVSEGDIVEFNSDYTQLKIPSSSLITGNNQKIFEQDKGFNFNIINDFFEHTSLAKLIYNDTANNTFEITLNTPIKKENIPKSLEDIIVEIDGLPYEIKEIQEENNKIVCLGQFPLVLENVFNQYIYIYRNYMKIELEEAWQNQGTVKEISRDFSLKEKFIQREFTLIYNRYVSRSFNSVSWINIDDSSEWAEDYRIMLVPITKENVLPSRQEVQSFYENNFSLNNAPYYLYSTETNKLIRISDISVCKNWDFYIGSGHYESHDVILIKPDIDKEDSDWADDFFGGNPSTYYDYMQIWKTNFEISNGKNKFNIRSSSIKSPELFFTLVQNNNLAIQYDNYGKSMSFNAIENSNITIDYSQWILKQDGKIIDQSQKSYFKVEDYQYDNFEPNSKYELYLKVHDKRNIDWESIIEIKTDKEFVEINSPESAEIKDKAVLIDMAKSISDFSYKNENGDSWNIKQNINYPFGDFIIKFQVSNKDKDLITISAKDNNVLSLFYKEDIGYYYLKYNAMPIDGPFSLNTETWYWLYYNSKEQNIKILDENNPNPIIEGSNIIFNNFESLFIGKSIKTFNIEFLTSALKNFKSSFSSWVFQWNNGTYFSYVNGDDKARISPASNFLIKRHELELIKGNLSEQIWMQRGEDVLENIEFSRKNNITLCSVDKKVSTIKDYGAGQGKFYQYEIIPLMNDLNKSYITNIINTDNWYEINLFGTKSYYKETINSQYEIDENNLWTFELDAKGDDITFNAVNTPNANSGSMYPKITTGNKNYLSGTVTMYLGSNNDGIYARDNDSELFRFLDFANNDSVKFLKLKNGMVIPVAITLKSSSNKSNLIGNPTTITVEWTQVDDAKKSSLIGIEEG